MRFTGIAPPPPGDVFTDEAVAGLVGHETRLRVGSAAYVAVIVAAENVGAGALCTFEAAGEAVERLAALDPVAYDLDISPSVVAVRPRPADPLV